MVRTVDTEGGRNQTKDCFVGHAQEPGLFALGSREPLAGGRQGCGRAPAADKGRQEDQGMRH